MRTDDFDYHLPEELIAQTPVEPRHTSRLLVLRRGVQELEHSFFYNMGAYLRVGDVLVINQTRVIPARIHARKSTGGQIEFLLLHRVDAQVWEALIGGKLAAVQKVYLEGGLTAEIIEILEGARRLVRFSQPVEPFLDKIGQMPLPPYIHEPLRDPNRYQTVYATRPGSAAAPTAGLHFTPELMRQLESMGVLFAQVTLHVGLDTFAPVHEDDPAQHQIHTEWCEVTPEAAEAINLARQAGGRIVAVGTTSVRTLETAAQRARPGETVQRPNELIHPARLYVCCRGYDDHQFSPAALDPVDAGQRVCRARANPGSILGGDPVEIPLLLFWRRHAHNVI
jgi:S-adenosylmethionine:tRNA ribosyltransferase-isomerase